ncbi:MAG: hypothetical protein JSU63_13115 [Phycisphaerales bacterium]|nr:MAG: hypothetical protein JSU63_13115 [Phycisphaerales bacterium]
MTWRAFDPEHKRVRLAIALLISGIILVLWAWGNWVYRTSNSGAGASSVQVEPTAPIDEARRKAAADAAPRLLMYTLLLILVVLFGGYALIRASRRHYEAISRKRAAPTATEDLWAMHSLPDDEIDGRPEATHEDG